jgi:hypothetical protein
MGCGDSELLAEMGDGSDILGRIEEEVEVVAAVVAVAFLPELAGAVPSLASADVVRVKGASGASDSLSFTF